MEYNKELVDLVNSRMANDTDLACYECDYIELIDDMKYHAGTTAFRDYHFSVKTPLQPQDVFVVEPDTQKDSSVDATVNERGMRYGKFSDGASIMQSLKSIMRQCEGWERLTPSQKEGLEMIQHKIGRILNGDPMYIENFTDIAGYATLLIQELNLTDGATDAEVVYKRRVGGSWSIEDK